jgi:hypothetical protein
VCSITVTSQSFQHNGHLFAHLVPNNPQITISNLAFLLCNPKQGGAVGVEIWYKVDSQLNVVWLLAGAKIADWVCVCVCICVCVNS